MMKDYLFAFVSAALVVSAAEAAPNRVDEDGCWDARDSDGTPCIQVTDTRWRDNNFRITISNLCSKRVYVSSCLGRAGGGLDQCGANGVRAYSDWNWDVFDGSGSYNWKAVGSTDPSADWVCAGKVPGW